MIFGQGHTWFRPCHTKGITYESFTPLANWPTTVSHSRHLRSGHGVFVRRWTSEQPKFMKRELYRTSDAERQCDDANEMAWQNGRTCCRGVGVKTHLTMMSEPFFRSPVWVGHPAIHDATPPSMAGPAPAVVPNGFLQNLLELPVEIFADVCGYFDVLDLRTLSISGRVFRSILMSRDARPIWAGARLRLYGSMPDPPENMSAPEYTRFLFSEKCYICNDTATEIDYFNKIKSCSTCFDKYYIDTLEAMRFFPGFLVRHFLPQYSTPKFQTRHYYTIAIVLEFQRYVDYISKGDSGLEFEYELEEQRRSKVKGGAVIETWMESEGLRQYRKLADRYEKREESIVATMIELGHDRRDVNCYAADSLGLLRLPYNLTEEEWLVMRSAVEEAAISQKADRIAIFG